MYGLAGNYAAALYSAGKKAKELDRVTDDISQVLSILPVVYAVYHSFSIDMPPSQTVLSYTRSCILVVGKCFFVQIAATAKGSSQFNSFLKDPTVPRKQRKDTLDEVLKKMEACSMTKNFIGIAHCPLQKFLYELVGNCLIFRDGYKLAY